MSDAKLLRSTVKEQFYPFAVERGFVRGVATSLTTPFQRVTGGKVHWLEIQWDKYHRPSFVINFCEFPTEDSDLKEVISVQLLPQLIPLDKFGRLQRHKGCSGWFRIRKPWAKALLSGSMKYSANDVVDELITTFPELESWWDSGVKGAHLNFNLN